MKLFLTSSPCDDEGGHAIGLPFVFREDNGFADRLRKRLPEGVLGVTLAADPDGHERNDAMAGDFAAAFEALGRPLSDMLMLDSRMSRGAIARAVSESGVVLLSGGHVPTQNAWFRRIGLKNALADYRGVVIGISAGSMNSCGTVYAQPEEDGEAVDPDYRRFIPGLGLTDVMILPHYQMVRDNILDGMRLFEDISIPDSRGRVFYAIPDGSYVLQEYGRAAMYGEAYRIADGGMEPWCGVGEWRRIGD